MPTVNEVGARVTWGEAVRPTAYQGDFAGRTLRKFIYVEMDDRADSDDPDKQINGDLAVWAPRGWPGLADNVTDDEALLPILTAMIVNDLHELTEYMGLDGVRVFDPHPSEGEDGLWRLLTKLAGGVAKGLLSSHPRTTETGSKTN
jgi:hypothetical protein